MAMIQCIIDHLQKITWPWHKNQLASASKKSSGLKLKNMLSSALKISWPQIQKISWTTWLLEIYPDLSLKKSHGLSLIIAANEPHSHLQSPTPSSSSISTPFTIIISLLAPSGALVVIMVYYIPAAPTFSDFSNSSDSKVKVKVKGPNMCYIF